MKVGINTSKLRVLSRRIAVEECQEDDHHHIIFIMLLVLTLVLFLSHNAIGRYHEKTRFDRSVNLFVELQNLDYRHETPEVFIDYTMRYVVFRCAKENVCYLEKMRDDYWKSILTGKIRPKVLYPSSSTLTLVEAWKLAGGRVVNFCNGIPMKLLEETQPVPQDTQDPFLNEIPQDDNEIFQKRVTDVVITPLIDRAKREIMMENREKMNGEEYVRVRRHAYPGKFRGQTQSQYLNFDKEGDKAGKAEAEATNESSRAVVSGTNGMGQAQSMTAGGSCEDCPGYQKFPPVPVGYTGLPGGGGTGLTVPGTLPGINGPGVGYPGTIVPGTTGTFPQTGGALPGTYPGVNLPGTGQGVPGTYPGGVVPPGGQIPGGYPGTSYPGGQRPGVGQPGSQVGTGGYPGGIVPGTGQPGTYPGVGQPGTYPGGSVPGTGSPGTYPGSNVPGTSQPGSYPGSVPGIGQPGTYPGVGQPGTYPGGSVPGTGQPGTYPGGISGVGQPGTYPGGSVPGTGQPGTYPGGSVPGTGQPGTYPGSIPGISQPGTYPGVGQPGTYPGGSGPGTYPGGSVPGTYPGVSVPGTSQPGTYPGSMPGVGQPGTYPGGSVPGTGQPGTYPGGTPGVGQPGTYPGSIPGVGQPGTYPGVGQPGTYPGGSVPGTGQPDTYPGSIPGLGQPGTYPGGSVPGTGQQGTYPGGTPGVGQPGTYPGGMPGVGQPGTYPGGSVPGTYPGEIPGVGQPGTYPGSLPGTGTGIIPGTGQPGTYPGGGTILPGSQGGVSLPGGPYPGGLIPPGGVYPPGTTYPGGVIPPNGTPGTYPGIFPPGTYPGTVPGFYPGGVVPPGALIPGQYPSGVVTAAADDADSHASSEVKQNEAGTQASASADGTYGTGTAKSQVSGIYTGAGSFSAQAGINDGNKGAQTQVSGGKEGAMSSAQGFGGQGKSQTQVQLDSETGATTTGSQSSGFNHDTSSQVQASMKGGMADAQANGEGSTSSQAQIGFQPYMGSAELDKVQSKPFKGGGTASAQSGTYQGQSQSQIEGSFQYGITYTGAAQAGSGSGAAASRRPFNFTNSDSKLFKSFDKFEPIKISSDGKDEPTAQPELDTAITGTHTLKTSSSTRKTVLSRTPTRQEPQEAGLETGPVEYDAEEDEEYEDDDYAAAPGKMDAKLRTAESRKIHEHHAKHDGLGKQDSLRPKEGDLLQPGDSLPGFTVPQGLRARVTSASGERAPSQAGGKHQPQTVILAPNPDRSQQIGKFNPDTRALKPGHNQNYLHATHSGKYTNPGKTRSMTPTPVKSNYYTVTNSVAGNMGDPRRKYEHRYYTKSSTCGYFTFSCNIVHGSNGRTKICKPKMPTYPDGTPMKC
ncbi:GSCOCG00002485001-RA-CDS [Cotesia congregata]|nr:GSCOCG00002485001-RA-CDS [Cotesia congregata]